MRFKVGDKIKLSGYDHDEYRGIISGIVPKKNRTKSTGRRIYQVVWNDGDRTYEEASALRAVVPKHIKEWKRRLSS